MPDHGLVDRAVDANVYRQQLIEHVEQMRRDVDCIGAWSTDPSENVAYRVGHRRAFDAVLSLLSAKGTAGL